MVVHYVEAPHGEAETIGTGWPAVFLAGGITGCPDWQADAVAMLRAADIDMDMVVFNPRRREFDIDDPHAEQQQVAWEFINIRLAGTVAFWFPAADVAQPTTHLELGAAIERKGQQIVIGIDPAYHRRHNLECQVSNAQTLKLLPRELLIHSTLEDMIADTIGQVRREWALLGG